MANTLSSTIDTSEAVHLSIAVLQTTIPGDLQSMVTMRLLPNSDKPKSQMEFKVVASVAATLVDPINFEQGDAVVNPLDCVPHYLCQSFNLSQADRSGGLRASDLLVKNAEVFGNTLWGRIAALFKAANFATILTKDVATFGINDLATLLAALMAFPNKNLILRPDYFAKVAVGAPYLQFLPSGAYTGAGFGRISQASDWSQADPKVVGIVMSESAIAVGSGLPVRDDSVPNPMMDTTSVPVPGLQAFQIKLYRWFSLATRSEWISLDSFIGASVANPAAAFLIKSL